MFMVYWILRMDIWLWPNPPLVFFQYKRQINPTLKYIQKVFIVTHSDSLEIGNDLHRWKEVALRVSKMWKRSAKISTQLAFLWDILTDLCSALHDVSHILREIWSHTEGHRFSKNHLQQKSLGGKKSPFSWLQDRLKSSITTSFCPNAFSFTATGVYLCFSVRIMLQFISGSLPLIIIISLR